SSLLRKEMPILRGARIQTLELQGETRCRIAILMDVGQTDSQQQAAGILFGQLAETVVIAFRRYVLLVLVGHHGQLQQGERLAAVETQGAGEVGVGLLLLAQLKSSHAHVLEYPRTL